MTTESDTRKLLIEACHSSAAAEQRILGELHSAEFVGLLVRIAVDADDHQGDAPMTAAFYLSKASPNLTKEHEASLVSLLATADGYAGSIALVLSEMKSIEARSLIASMAAEGYGHPFPEALARYEA